MPNKDIRDALRIKDVRRWQLAKALGIGEATLYRDLRTELSDDKKSLWFAAIDRIAKNPNTSPSAL